MLWSDYWVPKKESRGFGLAAKNSAARRYFRSVKICKQMSKICNYGSWNKQTILRKGNKQEPTNRLNCWRFYEATLKFWSFYVKFKGFLYLNGTLSAVNVLLIILLSSSCKLIDLISMGYQRVRLKYTTERRISTWPPTTCFKMVKKSMEHKKSNYITAYTFCWFDIK